LTLKTEEDIKKLTPFEQERWKIGELIIENYITARLGAKPRMTIAACERPYYMWAELNACYASTSVAAKNKLNSEWDELTQKNSQSVQEYIQEINYAVLNMESAGMTRDEDMKMHRLMSGLRSEWDSQKDLFETMDFTYAQACKKLIEMGHRKEREESVLKQREIPAYIAKRQGNSKGSWCNICGSNKHVTFKCDTGLTRNRDAKGEWIPRCFKCLKEGHVAKDCRAAPVAKKAAFVATTEDKESERSEEENHQA
jgi:hypothetical protein